MRPLALLGLFVSLLLGGVAIFDTAETASDRREEQDRALQAAIGAEVARVAGTERQIDHAAGQMLVNPAVSRCSSRGERLGAAGAADRDVARPPRLVRAERRSVPCLPPLCLDDARRAAGDCSPDGRCDAAFRRRSAASSSRSPRTSARLGEPRSSRRSPGRSAVAFLVPLRVAGHARGLVHLDVSIAWRWEVSARRRRHRRRPPPARRATGDRKALDGERRTARSLVGRTVGAAPAGRRADLRARRSAGATAR